MQAGAVASPDRPEGDCQRWLRADPRARRITGFLGPNGAGKSTTMRMILRLARPDRGFARIAAAESRVGLAKVMITNLGAADLDGYGVFACS
jgi:ABC-type Na+ transport system ATPase subunit NatA